jgi:hypothetical protein
VVPATVMAVFVPLPTAIVPDMVLRGVVMPATTAPAVVMPAVTIPTSAPPAMIVPATIVPAPTNDIGATVVGRAGPVAVTRYGIGWISLAACQHGCQTNCRQKKHEARANLTCHKSLLPSCDANVVSICGGSAAAGRQNCVASHDLMWTARDGNVFFPVAATKFAMRLILL